MTGTESKYKLDKAQTTKAVKALQAWMKKQQEHGTSKPNLLAGGDNESGSDAEDVYDGAGDPDMAVWLQITSMKYVTDHKQLKPHRIVLPHPLLKITPTIAICVIVKDPSASFKALVPKLNLPPTATLKITSPQSLRGKYKSFESRRQLERAHDVFLADERIVPSLPKILGKSIYRRASKIPIPINIEKKSSDPESFKKEIEKAIGATYLALSPSNCHSIRVGIRTMKADDVSENIAAVVEQVTSKYIPRGWRGVRGLHVKFAKTAALPIWLADSLYDPKLDVLTPAEVKAIEYKKSEAGLKARKQEKKENKKTRKEAYEEKKKNRRNWDSDVEEEEEKQLNPATKRKLAEEKIVETKDAAKVAKAHNDKKIMPPMPLKKRRVEPEKKLKRGSVGGAESKAKKQKSKA